LDDATVSIRGDRLSTSGRSARRRLSPAAAGAAKLRSAWIPSWPKAAAGPLLIVGAVVVVLHGFVFQARVSSQHPDVLGFWLPTYCFLGKSLAAGHLPAWNPHIMGGVPFAADPQSGWMYAPAMLLFSAFPCGVAIRLMIVLQPILGGLGLYGFLRSERLSRPAATTGGLALALGLAASRLTLFLPFPSAFAWTAVLLWSCSATLNAGTWTRRLGWVLTAAIAWGQLAAAYFSHGLLLGTGVVVFYLVAKGWSSARSGMRRGRDSLAVAGLLGVAFFGVNLAFLLPRLAYIPETSYGKVVSGPAQLGPRLSLAWPVKLGTSPGGYLGVAALVLAVAAFWSRRHRPLVVAFGAFGALSYVLGVENVASPLAHVLEGIPILDFYAHFPGRFGLGLFFALPVLAAIGLEAWMQPRPGRERTLMVAPGLLIFVVLPAALGAGWLRLLVPLVGGTVAAVVLMTVIGRPRLAAFLPALLALELVAGGLLGQTTGPLGADRAYRDDLFATSRVNWFVPLARPDVDVDAYLRPGPMARALKSSGSRYISLDPVEASSRGYLLLQDPGSWALMANERAMLFGLDDAQGYNPVQVARYWSYVRAVAGRPLAYNTSIFPHPSSVTVDLLQVGQIVAPTEEGGRLGTPPMIGWTAARTEGRWTLYREAIVPLRASLVGTWRVVRGAAASLRAVTESSFNPSRMVVLEHDPGLGPAPSTSLGGPGRALYRQEKSQSATVSVEASSPAIVVIRTPFARGWHATVDGRIVRLLLADHFLQGVPVSPGRHEVRLTYDDPWIGYGLAGSAVLLALWIGIVLLARRAERDRVHRHMASGKARVRQLHE
jgi:Bacterial membrane protein YfhO